MDMRTGIGTAKNTAATDAVYIWKDK